MLGNAAGLGVKRTRSMILVLGRGGYCPKDRRQHEGLAQLHRELEVGYCRFFDFLAKVALNVWDDEEEVEQEDGRKA
jgi:hypothetical protein